MNDFSSLPIKDWYALGSLVAQLGFLVAAVCVVGAAVVGELDTLMALAVVV